MIPRDDKSTVTRNCRILVLVTIFVVAILMRIDNINQPFIDKYGWRQSSTAMMADNFYRGNWNIFYPEVSWGGPGPNYQGREFQTVTYIAALFYKVVGQQEWVGRGVAVAFGLWGIFALYQLVRRVWDEERALVAAAVMAVLPGSVVIERSFLPDPAMVALVTTSLWMLALFCQTERRRYLWLAAFTGCLGFLTKLPGVILGIPAIYAVTAILGQKALNRRILFPLTRAGTFALLPVIAYYLWARHLALTYPPHHFAGSEKFIWDSSFEQWLKEYYFLPSLPDTLFEQMWTWPGAVLVMLGLICCPSKNRTRNIGGEFAAVAPWFFHWWMVAMGLRYVIEAKHLIDDPYNLHPINPAAAALAANVLVAWGWKIKRLTGVAAAGHALVAFALIAIAVLGYREVKQHTQDYYIDDYRLGLDLRQIAEKQDRVISFGLVPISIYYSGLRGWVFPPVEAWGKKTGWDYAVLDIKMLESIRAQGAKWVIISDTNGYLSGSKRKYLEEYYPQLASYIYNTYKLERQDEHGAIFRIPSLSESHGG